MADETAGHDRKGVAIRISFDESGVEFSASANGREILPSDEAEPDRELPRYKGRYIGPMRLQAEIEKLARRLKRGKPLEVESVAELANMVEANPELAHKWPGTFVVKWFRVLFDADGEVNADSWAAFGEALQRFSDGVGREHFEPLREQEATAPAESIPLAIEFAERCFCFTGKFAFGQRTECEKAVVALGAKCIRRPTFETDYLVKGSLGGAGSKVEQAGQLQAKGSLIRVLEEDEWERAVRQHG